MSAKYLTWRACIYTSEQGDLWLKGCVSFIEMIWWKKMFLFLLLNVSKWVFSCEWDRNSVLGCQNFPSELIDAIVTKRRVNPSLQDMSNTIVKRLVNSIIRNFAIRIS